MAGLLQQYSERNKELNDNSYDIPAATPIATAPVKGVIIRGDETAGFNRWDGMAQRWVPVKTMNYQGAPYWWDERTRQFYPFQAQQGAQVSTDDAKARLDALVADTQRRKQREAQATAAPVQKQGIQVEEIEIPIKNVMGEVVSRQIKYKDAKGRIYDSDPNE